MTYIVAMYSVRPVVRGLVWASRKLRDATTLQAKRRKMKENPEDVLLNVFVMVEGDDKPRHVFLLKSEAEALLRELEKDFSSTRSLDQIVAIKAAVDRYRSARSN